MFKARKLGNWTFGISSNADNLCYKKWHILPVLEFCVEHAGPIRQDFILNFKWFTYVLTIRFTHMPKPKKVDWSLDEALIKEEIPVPKMEFHWYKPEEPQPQVLPMEVVDEIRDRLSYAVRYIVKPGIKGEITLGKLRWRGIKRDFSYIHINPITHEKEVYNFFINDKCLLDYQYVGHAIEDPDAKIPAYPCIQQRKTFISLDFDTETLIQYEFWKSKRKAIGFGFHNSNKNPDGTYKIGGIVNQMHLRKEK